MSVIMILLVAVSTAQISSLVIINDDLGNNVYAIPLIGQTQYRTQTDGTDSTPMNSPVSNPGFEIAQAPSSPQGQAGQQGPPPGLPDGAPFKKQVLQVRQVFSTQPQMTPNSVTLAGSPECQDDEVVVGGGFGLGPLGTNAHPIISQSNAPVFNNWQVGAVNPGPNNANFVVFGECAKLVDAP